MKKFSKAICLLLLFVTISSTLTLTAYASGLQPETIIAAAGGSGTTPSLPGSGGKGQWSSQYQGLRFTVIDQGTAEIAYTFMGKDHLDLLFSRSNLDNMDYFGDGDKVTGSRGIRDSKDSLNCRIYTTGEIRSCLFADDGDPTRLVTSMPESLTDAEKNATINKLNPTAWGALPVPLAKVNGDWVKYGTAIRSVLYGDGETVSNNALLYVIMNLKSAKYSDFLWKPKPNYAYTPSEQALIDSGKSYPINMMANKSNGLIIEVEPIIWNKLSIDGNQYSYGVYGTQTAVGGIIKWLYDGGWYKPAGDTIDYGGWDISLFGRVGRKAMKLDRGVEFIWKDTGERWWLTVPEDSKDKKVTNQEIWELSPGWSLHLYKLYPGKHSSTTTYDPLLTTTPGQAPDPNGIPLLNKEDTSKTRVTNIVKTYQTIEDGNVTIHDGTYVRTNNPSNITIEDEPNYKVAEWYISDKFNNPTKDTNWDSIIKVAGPTNGWGDKPASVEVDKPDTTLYVRLVKDERIDSILPASSITILNNKGNPLFYYGQSDKTSDCKT